MPAKQLDGAVVLASAGEVPIVMDRAIDCLRGKIGSMAVTNGLICRFTDSRSAEDIMRSTVNRNVGRGIFGKDPEAYERARPDYPSRVYQLLHEDWGLDATSSIFEIGAGTGQATEPLLQLGWHVDAIEPDFHLAAVLANRLASYGPQLKIHRATFEEIGLVDSSFDGGIAAMSLHWLSPEQGLSKAFRLLRDGGRWAMWWTVFGDPRSSDDFVRKTEHLYRHLEQSPSHGSKSGKPFGLDKERRFAELDAVGFGGLHYEEIAWEPTLTTRQMVDLTATFSPVARLPEEERRRFLNEIASVVDREFGGTVTRRFVTVVYTAKKP